MQTAILLIAVLAATVALPEKIGANPADSIRLVDAQAHRRVKALYYNLKRLSGEKVLFGHQDALAYGVKWKGEKMRSDVKDVCGSHPAVFGWDVSKLGKYSYNIDTVDFDKMKDWIVEAYKIGGVNTISWHMDNPVTGGSSWDTTVAVRSILPGGDRHDWYKWKLDLFAEFVKGLKSSSLFGHSVPVIFRPFHEHTGSWFWWGKGHCTSQEYIGLWRFTVYYLRDIKGVHNLLYAYSPDVFETEEEYLEFYPGDDYVDIFGLDNYGDVSVKGNPQDLTRRLSMVAGMAGQRGKIAALTETGQEKIPNEVWWTDVLSAHIRNDPSASRIAYLMVWRNAWPNHHYAPYPGHPSAENFIEFRRDEAVLFADDLPDMYRIYKKGHPRSIPVKGKLKSGLISKP